MITASFAALLLLSFLFSTNLPGALAAAFRQPNGNSESGDVGKGRNPLAPGFKVEQQYAAIGKKDVFRLAGIPPQDDNRLPKPSGAAGLTTLVSTVHDAIEIRTKAGVALYQASLTDFFNISGRGYKESFFAQEVVYDQYEDRFVVYLFYTAYSAGFRDYLYATLFLAVSKTGSPVGPSDWYFKSIDTTDNQTFGWDVGVPALSIGPEAIYSRVQNVHFNDDFYDEMVLVFAKKDFYAGGNLSYSTIPFQTFNPNDYFFVLPLPVPTAFPAQVYGGPIGHNIGTYVVHYVSTEAGRNVGNTSYLSIAALQDPLGSPSFAWNGTVNLGEIDQHLFGGAVMRTSQLNSTRLKGDIDTGSTGVYDVAWWNNALWVAAMFFPFHGPNAGQGTAYWIKIQADPVKKKFTLEDFGEIGGEDIAAGTATFFPSVAVNSRGVAAIGFAASGPLIYVGAYVVGRHLNDPKGTVSKSFVVKEGVDVYDRFSLGDYTGISVDPVDDSFWVFNAYADKSEVISNDPDFNTGLWRTAWRRFLSTDCSDDNSGKFYVADLKAYKDCRWLANSATDGCDGRDNKNKPNYKKLLCQPSANYSTSRLLCAKTCGICSTSKPKMIRTRY